MGAPPWSRKAAKSWWAVPSSPYNIFQLGPESQNLQKNPPQLRLKPVWIQKIKKEHPENWWTSSISPDLPRSPQTPASYVLLPVSPLPMEFQVQSFAFLRHLRQHREGRTVHTTALAAGTVIGTEFLPRRGHRVLQFEEAAEASLILQHRVAVEVLGLCWGFVGWWFGGEDGAGWWRMVPLVVPLVVPL